MDDTQQSRVSDATAAATRKRRSSILKSQRPARTPFSDLEFNVATPTDTAKSRRVSFSRRTGVAEFVTNEATTTWKNFYEEHNKSLESSSNESEANASRQPVGHLGKRLFDQQFEEVEAVDFMSGLANGSLNNINFSQQLASLECTGEGKLTAPHNNFELSAFTEQSKLLGNDFTAPSLGEHSGRIDVNFSAIQQIEKDDLDEIEKDLERGSNNMGCHGPFSDRQNMSEYIEVDLNMTHVAKNDEDMSITDTVHSPVQDVSRSLSIDKKAALNNDWVADKENIAINPYAAPCDTNFAVNEEPDQVLVFDGKRLTLQPDIPEKDKNYRQTLLPNSSAETPQRKTIVLNVNDDLPNFAVDMLNSKSENSGFSGFQEIKTDEEEISDTLQLSRVHNKSNTQMVHDNTGNISMTNVLPTNIICQAAVVSQGSNPTMRRTIVFDKSSSDISVTEAVPAKVLSSASSGTSSERRRTVVYEDDSNNISMTQAVPSNILVNENADTVMKKNKVFGSDKENKTAAQASSSNILNEKPSKRKTIVFDDEACDVSFTQAVPSNIMLPEKLSQERRRTILYENDTGNVSVTQALPTNVILQSNNPNPERRRTIVYDEDAGNISVTQAIPSNIILEKLQLDDNKEKALPTNVILQSNNPNPERRRTIVYDDNAGNISVTQAIPSNIILEKLQLDENKEKALPTNVILQSNNPNPERRRTIVYDNDAGNISVTQAIPSNIILEKLQLGDNKEKALPTNVILQSNNPNPERRRTIVYDNDAGNISVTQAIPSNIILEKLQLGDNKEKALPTNVILQSNNPNPERRRTIVYDNDAGNISVTQAIPSNIILEKLQLGDNKEKALPTNVILQSNNPNPERRRTIVYDDNAGNISVTQAIPSNIILEKLQLHDNKENDLVESIPTTQSVTNDIPTKDNDASRRKTIVYEDETGDISLTQAIPAQLIPGHSKDKSIDAFNTSRKPKSGRRTTIVYDNDEGDISMTEAIPDNIIEEATNEGKTDVYDEDEANISMTLAISTNVFLLENLDSTEDCVKKSKEIKEVQEAVKPEEIKDVMEKLTEYDVYEDNLSLPADALQDEEKSNILNPEYHDCDMSMTMPLAKDPSLREIEKVDISMTKPIPSELITLDTELSDKLKDKLLDLTEPDQIANRQSDVIVLQNSRTNSKPMLQSSTSEQDDLRKIADVVSDATEVRVASSALVAEDVARSPVDDASLSSSLMHPTVEEKTNQISLVTVDNFSDGEDDAVMQTDPENTEMSLSITTMDSGTEDKNIMAGVDSPGRPSPSPTPSIKNIDNASSNESMFYITKDSEEEAQSQGELDKEAKGAEPKQISFKELPMLQLEEDLETVDEHQKKLADLETAESQNQSTRLFKNVSPDLKQEVQIDEDVKPKALERSYKKANDTQELLDMLSNLTDNKESDEAMEKVFVKVKEDVVTGHRRLSIAPSRQSMVLSREDLMNNISMAQAALQKSRLTLDESDSTDDDTRDTSITSDRANNDVVKTLQFNDESISEESLNEYSPLKKTAFGETSYMHETKAKVIPTYLKDVSDGMKELMLDLIKPINNEDLPFETGVVDKGVPTIASTQSTQVQANLVQSSQIDFEPDLNSESESSNMYKSRSARSPVKFSGTLSEFDDTESKETFLQTHEPAPPGVLIFDHLNPLNNVLIPPINLSEAHKYDPIPSKPVTMFDVFEASNRHSIGARHNRSSREEISDERDFDVQTVCDVSTKKLRVAMASRSSITEEDLLVTNTQRRSSPRTSTAQEKTEINIRSSPIRRPSLEKSVDAVSKKLRDYEVNTTISMKRNKELLETSSSLTLVDDGLESCTLLPDKEFSKQRIRFSNEAQEDSITKLPEDPVQDRSCSNLNASIAKGKKRIYSPSDKRKQQQSLVEVTPKPITKMPKFSSSPRVHIKLPEELSSTDESSHSMEPEKDENKSTDKNAHTSNTRDGKSPRTGKPGQTLTVRQLIADCISFDPGFNNVQDIYPKFENVTEVLGTDVSSSSGSVVNDVHSTSNINSQSAQPAIKFKSAQPAKQVKPAQVDRVPEPCATSSSQHDSESGVNVVAKIDMLPFMGSHECEWEASSTTNSSDTWLFRLMHGRLRLSVRLAHRLHNAPRTRVRGDTPVLDVAVEPVQHNEKNPVADMCVRFACEAMRHLVSCAQDKIKHASDIPPLLRRCAAVVRVGLRWGRAMHDTKLHLAYNMDAEGNFSLKVANILLRSVWEVTMRVQLDCAQEVAWPRACDVRVQPVVADVVVSDDHVRRAIEHIEKDWGHVPVTIWKVFKLLKHKKRDDDLFLIK